MTSASSLTVKFGGYISSVATLPALRNTSTAGRVEFDTILVSGALASGDGNGGAYVWDPASTAEDDNQTVIKPRGVTGAGRWKLSVGRGNVGPQGVIGPRGVPGGNVSDVGTLAQARTMDIVGAQPGTTTIRLSDRAKATFQLFGGASASLTSTYATGENKWWFKDAGNSFWILASNPVSIAHVGAATTVSDNTAFINEAFTCATLIGTAVYIPLGTFPYSGTIETQGCSLYGDGPQSTLQATAYNQGAIFVRGDGQVLRDFQRTYVANGPSGTRTDPATGLDWRADGNMTGHGVSIVGATNYRIERVSVTGGAGGGIFTSAGKYGSITHCSVQRTAADAYHTTGAYGGAISEEILLEGNLARDCGDDHFPIVSYTQDGGICRKIQIVNNRSIGGLARGLSCLGGSFVTFMGNHVEGCRVAGCLVDSDFFNGGTAGNRNIAIRGNMFVNTGSQASDNPNHTANASIHVSARADNDAVNITIDGNTLSGCRNQGILGTSDGAGRIRKLVVTGNYMEDVGDCGILLAYTIDPRVEGNDLLRTNASGVKLTNCSGFVRINRNNFESISRVQGSQEDCIHVELSTFNVCEISGNSSRIGVEGTQNYERFVEAFMDGVVAENNVGPGDVALGATPYSARQRIKGAAQGNSTSAASNAGAAPATLAAASSQADYNALVAKHNTLTTDFNALLGRLRDAGLLLS